MRFTQIRSSDIEHLFVSEWGKLEHRFSNSISAIVSAGDLCSDIKGWNNEIAFGIFLGEDFL